MSTARRRTLVASTVLSLFMLLTITSSASAWTRGNAWVNFATTNCPSGGKVVAIYWAVDNFSAGPAGGDWGDNVIYPSVRVGSGAYNTLSYQVKCKKWGWYIYRGKVGQRSIRPYKSGLSYTFY